MSCHTKDDLSQMFTRHGYRATERHDYERERGFSQKVADHDGRPVNNCYLQAGSDSLLTSAAFIKLANSFFSGLDGLGRYKDILYGYGELTVLAFMTMRGLRRIILAPAILFGIMMVSNIASSAALASKLFSR